MSAKKRGKASPKHPYVEIVIIVICVLISILYLGIYAFTFPKLSDNMADFIAFGTYISGLGSFFTIGTLIVMIVDMRRIRSETESIKSNAYKQEQSKYLIDMANAFSITNNEDIIINNTNQDIRFDHEVKREVNSVFSRLHYIYRGVYILGDKVTNDIVRSTLLSKLPKDFDDKLERYCNGLWIYQWMINDPDEFDDIRNKIEIENILSGYLEE